MVLDAAMPQWHWREQHRIATTLPATALLPAVAEVTWAEVRLFRTLMSARFRDGQRFPADEPVLGWFYDSGFTVLDESDRSLVLGLVRPARGEPERQELKSAAAYRDFADPGHLKIALAFWCEPNALVTVTRVAATDEGSHRTLALYWVFIRTFSGLIRREWLRAIRRRASRTDEANRQT